MKNSLVKLKAVFRRQKIELVNFKKEQWKY